MKKYVAVCITNSNNQRFELSANEATTIEDVHNSFPDGVNLFAELITGMSDDALISGLTYDGNKLMICSANPLTEKNFADATIKLAGEVETDSDGVFEQDV